MNGVRERREEARGEERERGEKAATRRDRVQPFVPPSEWMHRLWSELG